MSFLSMSR